MEAKERLDTYKEMLKQLRDDLKNGGIISRISGDRLIGQFGGFCWYLSVKNIGDCPELMHFKPKKLYNHLFWFNLEPRSGMRKRINILKKIIVNMESNERLGLNPDCY